MAISTLSSIAARLLVISQRINVDIDGHFTDLQIQAAAAQWKRYQRRRGRSHGRKARQRFIQIASDWLCFLGRLPTPEPEQFVGVEHLRDFTVFMAEERGLSVHTIHNRQKIIARFLKEFPALGRSFSTITVADIDSHLESRGDRSWRRTSIASSARALRSFFRYAGEKGWCSPAVAPGIEGPRVFKQEGLAVGPAWGDVERLILSTDGNTARDIRDQAILRLLATYGFRRGEVSRLRLDDVDWDHDRLVVRRPKQRGSQEYPLLPSVGDAIARYLQDARPKSPHREIFLTLRAPIVVGRTRCATPARDGWWLKGCLSRRSVIIWATGAHPLRGSTQRSTSQDCVKWPPLIWEVFYEPVTGGRPICDPQTIPRYALLQTGKNAEVVLPRARRDGS
jgi:site-specific recombinase XerD